MKHEIKLVIALIILVTLMIVYAGTVIDKENNKTTAFASEHNQYLVGDFDDENNNCGDYS